MTFTGHGCGIVLLCAAWATLRELLTVGVFGFLLQLLSALSLCGVLQCHLEAFLQMYVYVSIPMGNGSDYNCRWP